MKKPLLIIFIVLIMFACGCSEQLTNLCDNSIKDINKTRDAYRDAYNDITYIGNITISAYCPSGNLTYSGTNPRPYKTIAMCSDYPIGTYVYIESVGLCIVEDRGGENIESGERIDLFVPSYEEAIEFGLQKHKVYIVKERSLKWTEKILSES